MNITICDDEEPILQSLAAAVQRILPDAAVTTCRSGGAIISPDILLLDIRMPKNERNGMQTARILRDAGWDGILIFVTGEEGAVFDAFDVRAFQFLVKPVSYAKLKKVLEDAVSEWETKAVFEKEPNERFITVQSGGAHIRIRLSDIFYAEVFDRKTVIHVRKRGETQTEPIEYYGQLRDLSKLVGNDFFRVHRSYLVHLSAIERYNHSEIVLINGAVIPLSRRNYAAFVKAYMEYGTWM